MKRRGGFALLTVLWLLLLLSILGSTAVAPVALSIGAANNRSYQVRAHWAALACLDLWRSRNAVDEREPVFDSVAVGPPVWCSVEPLNPDERVNPNWTDSAGLQRVLASNVKVGSLLDWIDPDDTARDGGAEQTWYGARARALPRNGRVEDVLELRLIRGFEDMSLDQLERFTTRGTGALSAHRAPEWALQSITILTPLQARALVARRDPTRPLSSAEQVVDLLGLELTTDEFRELSRRLSFSEDRRTLRAVGSANAGPRVIRVELIADLVRSNDDLSIRQIEVR